MERQFLLELREVKSTVVGVLHNADGVKANQ